MFRESEIGIDEPGAVSAERLSVTDQTMGTEAGTGTAPPAGVFSQGRRLLSLAAVMIAVIVTAAALSLAMLYRADMDRQSELLELVIDALADPDYDKGRFEIIKARFIRELRNISKNSPSDQTVHEIYRLLMVPYWTEQEKIAIIERVTMDEVSEFAENLFRQVRVNVLSHGDVSLDATLARSTMLKKLLKNSEIVENVEKPVIRVLNNQDRYLRSMTVDHSDSALAVYFQGITVDHRGDAGHVGQGWGGEQA